MTDRYRIARGTALTSLLFVISQVPEVRESSANLFLIGSCFAVMARTLRTGTKTDIAG
jgi:hypothetical protein